VEQLAVADLQGMVGLLDASIGGEDTEATQLKEENRIALASFAETGAGLANRMNQPGHEQ
jgi:hypothetical protein